MRNTYNRNRRLLLLCRSEELRERFFEKVIKRKGGCWIWTGAVRGVDGYGAFWVESGFTENAHRVAYTIAYGMIPAGKIVMHDCDTRLCVRSSHLVAGTYKKNMQDAFVRGLLPATKGSRHGMAKLTEANVYEIRKFYASTTTLKGAAKDYLAKRYSVSRSCIKQIVLRQSWQHV